MKLHKRLASLLLCAALLVGLLPAVTPRVQAAERTSSRPGAQFGYSGMRDGDHVLFGYADEASTYPISWKILDNDADNCGNTGAMLLFSDEVLGSGPYSNHDLVSQWYDPHDCEALEWCAAYAESSQHFDTKCMQGRIRVVTKTGESDSWSDDGTRWPGKSTNIFSYNPYCNEWEGTPQYGKMFCLSLLEARQYLEEEDYTALTYDTKEESSWWLRNCLSYYTENGPRECYGLRYNAKTQRTEAEWYSSKIGMRPAFNFELPGNYSVTDYQSYGNQILLIAADETVNNPEGRLYAVPEYAEGESATWSMVVRDPNGHDNLDVMVNVTEGYLTPTAGEGVLTGQVDYPAHWWGSTDGIESIENEYLTALMVEKDTGKIAFMGTVGKMISTSVGGFNIPIPTGAKGKYDVYIFNEHNDGTGGVRYASDVKRVTTIDVQPDTTKPKVTVNSAQREGDYSARITAQSDKDGTLFCSVNGQTESVRCYAGTPVEFRLENKLLPGTQTIDVWATDAAGNESAKETITFERYTAPVRASVMVGTSALRSWNSVDGYDYLYLGTNRTSDTLEPGAPTKWRVLDSAETNTGSRGGLFILADKVPAAQSVEHPVFGAGAGAKTLLTTQRNQLTQQEEDALLATDLPWEKITTEDGLTLTDPFLSGQKLFLLSASEATNSRYGFVSDDSRGAVINYTGIATYSGPCPWALRSTGTGTIQGKSYEVSAIVTENGAVTTWDKMTDVLKQAGSSKIANYTFIRPAANLDKSKVLMTSSQSGKSGTLGTLAAPADYTGTEWKLTLIDDTRTGFNASVDKTSVSAGDTVTVTYSNAQTGTNEYVSAMLTSQKGTLLYYGKLANNSDSGSVNVTIPAELNSGTYTLKLFNEQLNEGWAPDYSGNVVTLSLDVKKSSAPEAPAAAINGASPADSYETSQTMTLSTASTGAEIWYTLTSQADGGEAYTSGPQKYQDGIALPLKGSGVVYTVKAWAEQGGRKSAEKTYTVTIQNQTQTLSVLVGGTQADPYWTEMYSYHAGDTVTVTAEQFDDELFDHWENCGADLEGFDEQKNNPVISFTMPAEDVTIRAAYVRKISQIELTMDVPATGEYLPTNTTSYALKDSQGQTVLSGTDAAQPAVIWTYESGWDQVSGRAQPTVSYIANVTLHPNSAEKIEFTDDVTAKVNGVDANIYRNYADQSMIVQYTFRTEPAVLTGIDQPGMVIDLYGATAESLQAALPETVGLQVREPGISRSGTIQWEDIGEITHTEDGSAQEITAYGRVTLPDDVVNPDNVPLDVTTTIAIQGRDVLIPPSDEPDSEVNVVDSPEDELGSALAASQLAMLDDGDNAAISDTTTAARTVTVVCEDTLGTDLSRYTMRYTYEAGSKAAISAAPVPNAMFQYWSVDRDYDVDEHQSQGVIEFTMPDADVTVTAHYVPVAAAMDLTLEEPVAGKKLDLTAEGTFTYAGTAYRLTPDSFQVSWTPVPNDGRAVLGTSYTARVSLKETVRVQKADGTYEAVDSSNIVFARSAEFTVNGETATEQDGTVYYTFPAAGGENTCPSAAFRDLDTGAWYHEAVDYALYNEWMDGVGDGTFAPEADASRAMALTVLWRFAGMPKAETSPEFTDVPEDAWYSQAVAWAASEGLVEGFGNGKFKPEDPVTREQLAVMLYRYAQSQGKGFTKSWMYQLPYDDADSVSEWAYEAVCWMTMHGVLQGRENNCIDPQGTAARAELAAMLMRLETALAE